MEQDYFAQHLIFVSFYHQFDSLFTLRDFYIDSTSPAVVHRQLYIASGINLLSLMVTNRQTVWIKHQKRRHADRFWCHSNTLSQVYCCTCSFCIDNKTTCTENCCFLVNTYLMTTLTGTLFPTC